MGSFELKFGRCKKGTKFEKIFHFQFDVTQQRQILIKIKWKIFSNLVPFSEGPNFTSMSTKVALKPRNYLFAPSNSYTGEKSCKGGPKDVAHEPNLFMKVTKPSFPCNQL